MEVTQSAVDLGVAPLALDQEDRRQLLEDDGIDLAPVGVAEVAGITCRAPATKTICNAGCAATTLGGSAIRAGDRVVMLYAAANRDPAVFAEPDRFDVRRMPNPHVAFGFGEHFCLGARIARLEARVFVEEFLRRFAGLELAGPVERVRSNQLNSTKRMPVRLQPR